MPDPGPDLPPQGEQAAQREPTALPSVGARILAFALILVAGAAGAFIGYSFVDLQCEGDCTVPSGLGAAVGGLVGAIGVAIVSVLALRAMGEWRTLRQRGAEPRRGPDPGRGAGSAGARDRRPGPPRVR